MAVITFKTAEDAAAALHKMDGQIVLGRCVRMGGAREGGRFRADIPD